MRALLPALGLVLALGLAPLPAAAHFEETNLNAGNIDAGDFTLSFSTAPATLYERTSVGIVVQIARDGFGSPLRGPEVEASATVAGPGPFSETRTLAPDGRGFFVASFVFPSTGVYSVNFDIRDLEQDGEGQASTTVEVFPNHPFRIRPIDTALVVYANQTTTFDFEIVNATLLTRQDYVQDLTIRMEHWADNHDRKISEQVLVGEKLGQGTWRFVATPTGPGMHHFRFASESGGFNYGEVPPLHASVDPPLPPLPPPDDERSNAPMGSVGLVAAAVLVALWVARARR